MGLTPAPGTRFSAGSEGYKLGRVASCRTRENEAPYQTAAPWHWSFTARNPYTMHAHRAFAPRLRRAAQAVLTAGCLALPFAAHAERVGCVTTEWKLLGANHRVCVESFADPKISGVTCHVSQARTGGISGSFGLAEDPSQFSLSCRQTGPIALPEKMPKEATVFSEDTSLVFKETKVVRLWDEPHRTLVYLAISRKLINGAPANSIATVPVRPWAAP